MDALDVLHLTMSMQIVINIDLTDCRVIEDVVSLTNTRYATIILKYS
jgi:hypothetical protein